MAACPAPPELRRSASGKGLVRDPNRLVERRRRGHPAGTVTPATREAIGTSVRE
jgi:hypothetical protein